MFGPLLTIHLGVPVGRLIIKKIIPAIWRLKTELNFSLPCVLDEGVRRDMSLPLNIEAFHIEETDVMFEFYRSE